MIAVGPFAGDVQAKIDFAWGENNHFTIGSMIWIGSQKTGLENQKNKG